MRIAAWKKGSRCFGQSLKFVLWLQGCKRACPGCIAPEWQQMNGGQDRPVHKIEQDILNASVEGVVFSGGEPLLQYHELACLICRLHESDLGVILYTGYDWKDIERTFPDILPCTDMVISGPYLEAYNDGRGLRGSANQEVRCLSRRYEMELASFQSGGRVLEIEIHGESVLYCGIPPLDAEVLLRPENGP